MTTTTHARAGAILDACGYSGTNQTQPGQMEPVSTRLNGIASRQVRFVSIEPGKISLHGIALTDGEYAVLRGIAERMKRVTATDGHGNLVDMREKLEC